MRKDHDSSRITRGNSGKWPTGDGQMVFLEADVAKVFPDSQSVNDALRVLAEAARRQGRPVRRRANGSGGRPRAAARK
jgi:hypothetical protein